jgi:hypothetical protein
MSKNPVALLNEIRGNVDYVFLGAWGTTPNQIFSTSVTIDGKSYCGTGATKKVQNEC